MEKKIFQLMGLFVLLSFTHPFAQEGSVNNDSLIMEQRLESARQHQVLREYTLENPGESQRQEAQEDPKKMMVKKRTKLNEAEKLIKPF